MRAQGVHADLLGKAHLRIAAADAHRTQCIEVLEQIEARRSSPSIVATRAAVT